MDKILENVKKILENLEKFLENSEYSVIFFKNCKQKVKSIARRPNGGAPPSAPPPRALGGHVPPGPYGWSAPVCICCHVRFKLNCKSKTVVSCNINLCN